MTFGKQNLKHFCSRAHEFGSIEGTDTNVWRSCEQQMEIRMVAENDRRQTKYSTPLLKSAWVWKCRKQSAKIESTGRKKKSYSILVIIIFHNHITHNPWSLLPDLKLRRNIFKTRKIFKIQLNIHVVWSTALLGNAADRGNAADHGNADRGNELQNFKFCQPRNCCRPLKWSGRDHGEIERKRSRAW